MFCVVLPLLHVNVNGAVPFVTTSVTPPFDTPHAALEVVAESDGLAMLETVVVAETVQPFAAVTVTA